MPAVRPICRERSEIRANDGRRHHPSFKALRNVGQFVVVKTLDVVLLHQRVDVLLDIGNLRRETVADLVDDLFDELDVSQLLATLHDTHNDSLADS